jgi:hypothetical protein
MAVRECEQEMMPGVECGYPLREDGSCPNEAAHLTEYTPPRIVEHEGHKWLNEAEDLLNRLDEEGQRSNHLAPAKAMVGLGLAIVAHGRALVDAVDQLADAVASLKQD